MCDCLNVCVCESEANIFTGSILVPRLKLLLQLCLLYYSCAATIIMDVGDSLWRHSTYCDVIRGRDSRPPLEILYCYTHIHTKLECLLSLIGNNHHVVQICMHVWCTMSKVTQNDFGCCYSKVDFFVKLFRCRFSCFQFVLLVFLSIL